MLGIPYWGTKIEANSRNSVPNHSEEKTTGNFVPWNKNIEANFRNFVPKDFAKENTFLFWLVCKTNFFVVIPFRSELGFDSSVDLGMFGMSTFFRRITKTKIPFP
jgi:hypothetical protein